MAFRNPVKIAKASFDDSVSATCMISNAIKGRQKLDVSGHIEHAQTVLKNSKANREASLEIMSESIMDELPVQQKRVLDRVLEGKMSGWLSVLPIAQDGFDLSASSSEIN